MILVYRVSSRTGLQMRPCQKNKNKREKKKNNQINKKNTENTAYNTQR